MHLRCIYRLPIAIASTANSLQWFHIVRIAFVPFLLEFLESLHCCVHKLNFPSYWTLPKLRMTFRPWILHLCLKCAIFVLPAWFGEPFVFVFDSARRGRIRSDRIMQINSFLPLLRSFYNYNFFTGICKSLQVSQLTETTVLGWDWCVSIKLKQTLCFGCQWWVT